MEEIFLIVVVNVGQIFWVVLAQSATHLLMICSDRTFGHPLTSLRFKHQFCLKLLTIIYPKILCTPRPSEKLPEILRRFLPLRK
jgi:hypothetical protein